MEIKMFNNLLYGFFNPLVLPKQFYGVPVNDESVFFQIVLRNITFENYDTFITKVLCFFNRYYLKFSGNFVDFNFVSKEDSYSINDENTNTINEIYPLYFNNTAFCSEDL